MMIYSEPTPLDADELQSKTLGIGTPRRRKNSIVATSLAMPYLRGMAEGYGRRTMTFNPLRNVASKIRHEPPSATLVKSIISVMDCPTDLATTRQSSSTLK